MNDRRLLLERLVAVCLVVVAFIHLLPLQGLLGAGKLASLYGVAFDDPTVVMLMRHRAVLFGLLGGFLLLAAVVRRLQPLALLGGFISVLSFEWLAWGMDQNAQIARVVWVDWVALALLVVALVLRLWLDRTSAGQ